jgi:hypothetical protein
LFFLQLFIPVSIFAQQGVHGPRTITAANTIVNEYTAVTANITAGSTTITVANSALNANGRFTGNLAAGDLIMIYQPVGAIIRNQFDVTSSDTTWGRIDPGNYYGCGRYELAQVRSVPTSTTIELDCGTTYDYFATGGTPRKVMVIRVPRWTTLTVNAGGVLTCDDWNGTTGGVLAVEVQGNMVVNAGGSVDATGRGFRGGSLVGDNATAFGVNTTFSTNSALGAEKGEGVAGYQAEYDVWGGRYCRAPGANGGGGGDGHNAGGGGGANGPNSTSTTAVWSGNGIPDQSTTGWTTAWSIEPPAGTMNLRTSTTEAGGGRGGYTFSGSNQNATTVPPGNAAWGGDARNHLATGLGGRPLDYSDGRLFFGGGGGAGDQNNSGGGVGGDGGGLIYMMVYGTISGSGTFVSNGLNGANGQGGTGVITGIDAGGGGGAGGTIVLNAAGGVANTLTMNANGGNGGNQVINLPFSTNEGEGPGGGGGGGYLAVSSGTPTRNANGGNNGTTNSAGVTEFIPNGATKGCPGTNNASITNFTISLSNTTICTGNSTTLTATIGGTPPPGYVINWYTGSTGGTPIFTGAAYNTGPLATTTTYWVGTCAGWFRKPVTVTVGPAPIVSAGSNVGICIGQSPTLTATGATTYTWAPGTGLSATTGASVTATPTVTTTYTVTGTVGLGCSNTNTVTVSVNPLPTINAGANIAICDGSSTTLTATGGSTYTWAPGTGLSATTGSSVTASPATTTTYTVTGGTTGCNGTAMVTVSVNPLPTISAGASVAICNGSSAILIATGGSTYLWSPGTGLAATTGSSVTASPSALTTYTVTGTDANSCSNNAAVTVSMNTLPTISAGADVAICTGNATTLTATGGSSYTWLPGTGLSATTGSSVTASPSTLTTYTVTGTDANSCSNTATVTVSVNALPTIGAGANVIICAGNSTTLTATGGAIYTWTPGTGLSATTGSSITANPSSLTIYMVTGTDANSCSNTATVTVSVNSTPSISAGSSGSGCSGTILTASGGTTYTWAPPTSLSATTGASVTANPSSLTLYTVTGSTAGCNGIATVTVNPSAGSVSFDNGSSQNMLVCASSLAVPLFVQLAASGSPTGTFTYSVITAPTRGTITGLPASVAAGTGVYPSAAKYQPTYGYTGSDVFVIRVSNGSCTALTTVNVTVSGAMPAPVYVTGGGGYCSGGTGINVGITGSAVGISYQLYRGATPIGSPRPGIGMGFNFGPQTTAGTYTVMAINGVTGCMVACYGSVAVTVYTLPAVFSVTGGGGYCTGGTGVSIGLSGSVSGVSYKLYKAGAGIPAATTTGTGAALNFGRFTAAGVYSVTATAPVTGCISAMTGSATVTVNPNPTISGSTYVVAPGGSTTLTSSISGGSWRSSNPAVATIGSTTGTVTGVAIGTTVITYTLPTDCYGVRIFYVTKTGGKPAAYEPSAPDNAITVTPNPSDGTFRIKGALAQTAEQQVRIQVTNVLGQQVYANTVIVHDGQVNETIILDGNLASGMYILTLQAGDETRAVHITVQR